MCIVHCALPNFIADYRFAADKTITRLLNRFYSAYPKITDMHKLQKILNRFPSARNLIVGMRKFSKYELIHSVHNNCTNANYIFFTAHETKLPTFADSNFQ